MTVFYIILLVSCLLGVIGSMWILNEKRLPKNIYTRLIYAVGQTDLLLATGIGVLTILVPVTSNQAVLVGFNFFNMLVYNIFLLLIFSISLIPTYIIVFGGSVVYIEQIPITMLCLQGGLLWTLILLVAFYFKSNLVMFLWFPAIGFIVIAKTICFIISWKGLQKDQEKRKHHLSVGSANTFEMREYYLRTASFKMAKFAKYFSIFPLIHGLPLASYFVVSKIKIDNYTLYQNYFLVIVLCLVAANGFFHALIVHYSLLTQHFTSNVCESTKTVPDFDLTSITVDKKANGDVFFFSGQRQITIQELSIAKIKS